MRKAQLFALVIATSLQSYLANNLKHREVVQGEAGPSARLGALLGIPRILPVVCNRGVKAKIDG
jgi:hypothetical protein